MNREYLLFLLILFNINIFLSDQLNLRSTASCPDHTFLPTKQNVKIIGRYYKNKDAVWIIWSGSAIEFYASGNYVEMDILGDNNIYQDEDNLPRFSIYVDDKPILDTKMRSLEYNLQFKIPYEEGLKTKVKIMLLSENQNGGIGIKNILINSCLKEYIIVPTVKKEISIEFIGDSITNAYGVEAPDETYHFSTSTENFSKSYAYLAAQLLDADYSSVSLSGHGIVSGYSSNGDKWADGIMPLYYEKISRNKEYPGDWDFENNKYDVIFINLGTNDANYVNADREVRKDEFVEEFANFLQTVRDKNPDSYILCTLGTLNPKDMYELVEEGIKLFGGKRISSFESPVQDIEKNGLGADWHPSKKTQEKLAKLVAEKIEEILK